MNKSNAEDLEIQINFTKENLISDGIFFLPKHKRFRLLADHENMVSVSYTNMYANGSPDTDVTHFVKKSDWLKIYENSFVVLGVAGNQAPITITLEKE